MLLADSHITMAVGVLVTTADINIIFKCRIFANFAFGISDSTAVLKHLLIYVVFALSYLSMGAIDYVPQLDVYGEVMECRGDRSLVPFRYQGQYEDSETRLYYNRFRYYSPEMGMYKTVM
ncbi:MAG: hypothetical protein HDR74_04960 [Bacteroides sp.]|nr:hypothetical protein [Bacteroides sp.]